MAIGVHLAILALGLIILVKGADYFVKSAAAIAKTLGVSELVIGLTLVAVGTSIPELASSIAASMEGASGLVVGNAVGSNIANVGLILGVAALVRPIKTSEKMLKRDGYIMLAAACLFSVLAINGVVAWYEGLACLFLFTVYTLFLVHKEPGGDQRYHFSSFVAYLVKFKYLVTVRNTLIRSREPVRIEPGDSIPAENLSRSELLREGGIALLSCAAVILGAKLLVDSSISIAKEWGVPDAMIGLTLVAFGTSVPELTVSAAAARKGLGDIAIGNVLGSNIANILLIGAVASLIHPLRVDQITLVVAVPSMLLFSMMLLLFIKTDWEIRRGEGIVFLLFYAFFNGASIYLL